jgi:hypothetical protein
MDTQELYDWILDNLTYRLEKVDGKHGEQWCYPEGDSSGRDFYKEIPIQYLSDDSIESIAEEVFDDFEYEYDDADWEDFHEIFEEVFYDLVDENLGK